MNVRATIVIVSHNCRDTLPECRRKPMAASTARHAGKP